MKLHQRTNLGLIQDYGINTYRALHMKEKIPTINKFIIADISVIRDKGIGFLKGSENWPVAEEEYQEFSKYMYQQYESLMFELEGSLFDLALIDYKFQGALLKIFHYNYMKNYAQKHNIEILYGSDSQNYLKPDWKEIGKSYSSLTSCHSKLTRVVRRVIKNIIFNNKNPQQKLINFTKKTIDDIKSGKFDDKLQYRKGLRKSVDSYTKMTPPHVKAAKLLDKIENDIIIYYLTIDGPQPIQKLNSKIDYEHYIEKQIKPIAESIFLFFDLTFDDVLKGSNQKKLFGY